MRDQQHVRLLLRMPHRKNASTTHTNTHISIHTLANTSSLEDSGKIACGAIAWESGANALYKTEKITITTGGEQKVVEQVVWDERAAIQRCGFLFIAYEVQFWYFELFEITRKLLITCVTRFMYPDSPAQVSHHRLVAPQGVRVLVGDFVDDVVLIASKLLHGKIVSTSRYDMQMVVTLLLCFGFL
jgi:hypothetical protein